MVETKLSSIMAITQEVLSKNEDLWLHSNADELRQRVEEILNDKTPSGGVDRCRRKLFEEAVMAVPGFDPYKVTIIKDKQKLDKYIKTSKINQEKCRKFFAKRSMKTYGVSANNIKILADGRQEILLRSDQL